MIDLLFSKQEEWATENNMEEKLVEYAKSLALDGDVFKMKLEASESAAVVQQDLSLGNNLKLSGTPTIYVNGEQVAADFVEAKVKELLK
jgi:protein-disulfide isomerase